MIRSLYLVELTVADWPAALAWYRDLLQLPVERLDEPNRFALLQAGPGRIALKAGQPAPGNVMLTFEVDDLPAELGRLQRRGIVLESSLKRSPEGYRRALLRDADGHRICLFDWPKQ